MNVESKACQCFLSFLLSASGLIQSPIPFAYQISTAVCYILLGSEGSIQVDHVLAVFCKA